MSRDTYAKIVEELSKIPNEERSNLAFNTLLENRNADDRVELITALLNISGEQRTNVLKVFEVLINQKFMVSYGGYHDAKIINVLAKFAQPVVK